MIGVLVKVLNFLLTIQHLPTANTKHFTIAFRLDLVQFCNKDFPFL